VRGRAGNEASDLAFALTPTASVAGRLPTTVGDTWRDKVGTRATGITVVVVSLGVELSALATFQPFGGAASWEIAAWVVCLLATVAFLVYSGGFAGEPRQWQQDKIQDMFESLERIGSVGR
jgi:drug/metabolite transporter (DMT)-like permease